MAGQVTAMIQKNSPMKFEDLPSYKAGLAGEKAVFKRLENRLCQIFKDGQNSSFREFDFAWMNRHNEIKFGEVKTKTRMNIGPYQGINKSTWLKYMSILSKNPGVQLYLFFVDRIQGVIHYRNIRDLKNMQEIPEFKKDAMGRRTSEIKNWIVYWPTSQMYELDPPLTAEEKEEIKKNERRNYKFLPAQEDKTGNLF